MFTVMLSGNCLREVQGRSDETRLAAEGLAETGEVLGPRDGAGTEAGGVVGDHLDVEEPKAALAQVPDQAAQPPLRAVTPPREHRFAGEQPADGHAVDPARQLIADPDLEAVGMAAGVQLLVGPDHR